MHVGRNLIFLQLGLCLLTCSGTDVGMRYLRGADERELLASCCKVDDDCTLKPGSTTCGCVATCSDDTNTPFNVAVEEVTVEDCPPCSEEFWEAKCIIEDGADSGFCMEKKIPIPDDRCRLHSDCVMVSDEGNSCNCVAMTETQYFNEYGVVPPGQVSHAHDGCEDECKVFQFKPYCLIKQGATLGTCILEKPPTTASVHPPPPNVPPPDTNVEVAQPPPMIHNPPPTTNMKDELPDVETIDLPLVTAPEISDKDIPELPLATEAKCHEDKDCEAVVVECGGCNCIAVDKREEEDLVCSGHLLQCPEDPCWDSSLGKTHGVKCQDGFCTLSR